MKRYVYPVRKTPVGMENCIYGNRAAAKDRAGHISGRVIKFGFGYAVVRRKRRR